MPDEDLTQGEEQLGEASQTPAPPAESRPQQQQQQEGVQIDDSGVQAKYSNFCRVSSTPEEVILDLGLNPQPTGGPDQPPIQVSQRVVLNHYTAKRLLHALGAALQRHEQTFGPLETDIRKRVKR